MAGEGPAPKPADQRARRNKPPTAAVLLPSEGHTGPIPAWPVTSGTPTTDDLEMWGALWRTPQAAAWLRMGAGTARVVARYVTTHRAKTPGVLQELRQLEDRLGLHPLALRRLGWEIAPNELEQRQDGRSESTKTSDRYRGLRVTQGGKA